MKLKSLITVASSVAALALVGSPVVASAAVAQPMATYSSSFNVTFYELSVPNVDPNGSGGDFSWGGTFSSSYKVELVNSSGVVKYTWNEPAGTITASSNEKTVAAGDYTCEFIATNSAQYCDGDGTVYWD
ncbi:hypothetical protein [Alicyclobacillus acidiphilus]|uniref:hypothetical protein n=1 Tax=Alicyclobacillus acidiphilus TaxID=182455 RepID=UPI000A6783A7|nr:hypothetical protein [Alicyclobacillus acidiphilus]